MKCASERIGLLVFCVNRELFAIPLTCVNRVVRAVERTPVPDASAYIEGLINVHGQIYSVINTAVRLGFNRCPIRLSDKMILLNTVLSTVLLVNNLMGVYTVSGDELIQRDRVVPEFNCVDAIMKLNGQIVMILDQEEFSGCVLPQPSSGNQSSIESSYCKYPRDRHS
ncbi:hypothetical protein BVY04_04075 [bacterium M21]|nr:hypothetical protein BVY04_04040 [bacterium M21]OVE81108.1 hypothetical protein BVY04_04075 [bacterium M21]